MKTVTDLLHPSQREAEGLSGQAAYLARRDARMAHKAMEGFGDMLGPRMMGLRFRDILRRKQKQWNGRIVFRMICSGCGRERWESEYVCWLLMDLDNYYCAWCQQNGPPAEDGQQVLFEAPR